MQIAEILAHCESNSTLALASNEDLSRALQSATREIHRYSIASELKYRARKVKPSQVQGMTKNRYSSSMNRVPTKRELR